MRTTSAIMLLSAGAAAGLLSGCLPIGGCGGADPTDVSTFQLTAAGTVTWPVSLGGIAAAPDGVWLLEDGPEVRSLVEVDHVGGRELHRFVLDATDAFGLAWDGAALWVGTRQGGTATALRIDATTGAVIGTVALPAAASDLAWDGSDLLVVQGLGDIEMYEPRSAKLVAAVPVRRLDAVVTVASHDGETWVAQPGDPALVYDATGTLLATVTSGAFDARVHMAFVGEDLIVATGTSLETFSVQR